MADDTRGLRRIAACSAILAGAAYISYKVYQAAFCTYAVEHGVEGKTVIFTKVILTYTGSSTTTRTPRRRGQKKSR